MSNCLAHHHNKHETPHPIPPRARCLNMSDSIKSIATLSRLILGNDKWVRGVLMDYMFNVLSNDHAVQTLVLSVLCDTTHSPSFLCTPQSHCRILFAVTSSRSALSSLVALPLTSTRHSSSNCTATTPKMKYPLSSPPSCCRICYSTRQTGTSFQCRFLTIMV